MRSRETEPLRFLIARERAMTGDTAPATPAPPGVRAARGPISRPPQPPSRTAASWRDLDADSRSWWERLHAIEPVRSRAIAELHERLRREAVFHIRLRVRRLTGFPRSDIDDLAVQVANDALMALLRKLEDYRGESRFWTWARRFAELEAPVSIRRRLGRDRVGISDDPERALRMLDRARSTPDGLELRELLQDVLVGMADQLTPRQRTVLIATAINGVPAQALAEELNTTPGAIYKTLHDARVKLRLRLAAREGLAGGDAGLAPGARHGRPVRGARRSADGGSMQVDIRLKRAYEPASPSDGYRVLVDRLWPRGVSKQRAKLDAWEKELAPSADLREWFGHQPDRFGEFRRRYIAELRRERPRLTELRRHARNGALTLVYAARDTENNDAVVLAEVLRRGLPSA